MAGDEAMVAAMKAITEQAAMRAEEAAARAVIVAEGAHKSAETAMGAAQKATSRAEEAARASREATSRSEEIALAAKKAAEEALAKSEEALIRAVIKRLPSGTWMAVLILTSLCTIFAAVMLSAVLRL